MSTRQRSGSSLSQVHPAPGGGGGQPNLSSPDGYGPAASYSPGGASIGGRPESPAQYLPTEEMAMLAQITDFDNSSAYGGGDQSPYPTMTATYVPGASSARPRAHTASDSNGGPVSPPGAMHRNRHSVMPGLGMRNYSSSVLEQQTRLGGTATNGGFARLGGTGPYGNGASLSTSAVNVVPPPPPFPPPNASFTLNSNVSNPNLPAVALNQREYQPQYAKPPENRYQNTTPFTPPPPPPLPLSSSSSNGSLNQSPAHSQYITPALTGGHQAPLPGHPFRSSPAVDTGSYASTISSFDGPDSEYNTPHTAHSLNSTSSRLPGSSGQSPVTGANRGGAQMNHIWTLPRVLEYVYRNGVPSEWQQALKNLNVQGREFIEIYRNPTLSDQLLAEVMRISPGSDPKAQREVSKNLNQLVQEMVSMCYGEESAQPTVNPTPGRPTQGQRKVSRSATMPDFNPAPSAYSPMPVPMDPRTTSQESVHAHRPNGSDTSARFVQQYPMANIAAEPHRHSPSNSQSSYAPPPPPYPSMTPSPHSSPKLGLQPLANRHNKTNSTESAASSNISGMAPSHPPHHNERGPEDKAYKLLGIKGKGDSPHDRSAGFDSVQQKHSGGKIGKFFKRINKDKHHDVEESPTSPSRSGLSNMLNESSSSVDRTSVSSLDGMRKKGGASAGGDKKPEQKYTLVTRDGRVWVLVELNGKESVAEMRKEICTNLQISDWEGAHIYVTEVGLREHADDMLMSDDELGHCRDKLDNLALVKFFVRPSPFSAIDSQRSSMYMEQHMSPSKQAVERGAEPRPAAETMDSQASTLTQNDYDKATKKTVDPEHRESPTVSPGQDELDDIRRRIEIFGNFANGGNSQPAINVHPPLSPNPPQAQSSVSLPEKVTNAQTGDDEVSPVDAGLSPGGAGTELWFVDRSQAQTFSTRGKGVGTASAGTKSLEAAARSKLEPQGETRRTDQSRQRQRRPPDIDAHKKPGTSQRPFVDFDNPRQSPFKDRRMEDLIPVRQAPAPPPDRTPSISLKGGQRPPGSRGGPHRRGEKRLSVDKEKPPMEMSEVRQRAQPPPSNSPGGIGSALISAGALSAGITRTPIPGVRRNATPTGTPTSPPQPRIVPRMVGSPGPHQSPGRPGGKRPQISLQIPKRQEPAPSAEVSPMTQMGLRRQSVASVSSNHSHDVKFTDPDVQFSQPVSQGEEEDSDEDDGLFAVPLRRATDSNPTTGTPNGTDGSGTEAKAVKFNNPTPPTSHNTASSTPPSPEFERGDDSNGLNSANSGSGPHSAQIPPSPGWTTTDGDRPLSMRTDISAARPAEADLVDHLDMFFPNVDLDQPIEEVQTQPSSPPSSSPSTEKPQSFQLSDPPVTERPPNDTVRPRSIVAARNVGRSGLGRVRSIREVARGAHERRNTRRITQPPPVPPPEPAPAANPAVAKVKSGDLMRRKSTKLWNAKLIEMTPEEAKRSRREIAAQARKDMLQEENNRSNIQRQATFRWFKGQLIGKGTYGRVYLGMNATTGDFLAVKQVEVTRDQGNDSHQKEMIKALNQEIETMQHLDHVNIVQYLGCERKEYSMSIFLEYISGGSVGSCLRKHGRFEETVVASLTRQTLEGLEYLHNAGILHRDMKADNLLLNVEGTCKISDFGISKKSGSVYDDDPGNSMQGSVFWMAPEVIRPEGQGYSAKIDIWSLGCVVLEMLAGRRPWSKEEAIGAIYKLGSERQAPPIPDDVRSDATPAAIVFLGECFLIDSNKRPTATELLREPFAKERPEFDFTKTELYRKLKGAVRNSLTLS